MVEVLANADLKIDTKADFSERANLEASGGELKTAGIDPPKSTPTRNTRRSTRMFHDSTNAERHIGIELSHQPEYRRYRVLAKQIAKFNTPPFTVFKNENRDITGQLARSAGPRQRRRQARRLRAALQRSGRNERRATGRHHHESGKANAARVRLEDLVATDQIFTTLMGEDVESRRKFIEDNALDVKNLDV